MSKDYDEQDDYNINNTMTCPECGSIMYIKELIGTYWDPPDIKGTCRKCGFII